jgi:hypothetical protein
LPELQRHLLGAAAIDGWILLSTEAETFALPVPADG